MVNKKRLYLNISFFLIIVLTLLFHISEYFYYKNELEIARKLHGEGYYVAELFMLTVPISLLITVTIETSIYLNLHYFIINNNKTTIKTVFNALVLVLAVIVSYCLYIR